MLDGHHFTQVNTLFANIFPKVYKINIFPKVNNLYRR